MRAICAVAMLGAVGRLLTGANGCGGSGDAVARVGGETLSAAALKHWESVDAAVREGPTSRETPSKSRVLGFLLSSEWLVGEARELGVWASEGKRPSSSNCCASIRSKAGHTKHCHTIES
jgi:hypothetical protein